ncbi:MAG: hypothetical protein FJ125_04690 [Deltaproteobacteria bacterium]|nr:hypothetical protein [Deltaproteobacteria bacterium]
MTVGVGHVDPLVLEGEVLRPPRRPLVALLQALSGWSLLAGAAGWVGRLLLGARHAYRIELSGDRLRVERRRMLLRRTVRQQEDTVLPGGLLGWGVEHRRSTFLLLLGVLAFSLGAMVGLFVLCDSLRAGFPLFGLIGLLIIGVGVTLDLASLSLFELGPERSIVWLALPGQSPLRLAAVAPDQARTLIARLDRWCKPGEMAKKTL